MPERATAKARAHAVPKPAPPVESAPKIAEHLPELEFTRSRPEGVSAGQSTPETVPSPALDDEGFELDFTISQFDRNYSESSVMGINVDHDVDSMQADIEQVAVLYSNGQDAAARALLEAFVKF